MCLNCAARGGTMEEILTWLFDNSFHFSAVCWIEKGFKKPSLGLKTVVCNCQSKLPLFALHGAAGSKITGTC